MKESSKCTPIRIYHLASMFFKQNNKDIQNWAKFAKTVSLYFKKKINWCVPISISIWFAIKIASPKVFQCIFAMFASLLYALMQTFIGLFAPVFDGSILNFIHASGGTIAAIFNGLIDRIIEYTRAAICGTNFPNNSCIFKYGIGAGCMIVCLFIGVICVEQFAAIIIDCIDGLTCLSLCGAITNGLLCLLMGFCNFAVLTATTLTTNLCLFTCSSVKCLWSIIVNINIVFQKQQRR